MSVSLLSSSFSNGNRISRVIAICSLCEYYKVDFSSPFSNGNYISGIFAICSVCEYYKVDFSSTFANGNRIYSSCHYFCVPVKQDLSVSTSSFS